MADARQDQGAFSPDNRVNRTGGEVKSAIKQADPGHDETEWTVFDEQGRDHGGAHAKDSVEGATPGGHTELASFPSGAAPK